MKTDASERMWLAIRLMMFLVVAATSPIFYEALHAEFNDDDFSWRFVLILLVIVTGSVLFVLGLQYKNPFAPEKWFKPSWRASFVDFRQPTQTLHTCGWIFVVLAISVGIYTLLVGSQSLLGIFPFTIGVGLLLGVKLSLVVFRGRFV